MMSTISLTNYCLWEVPDQADRSRSQKQVRPSFKFFFMGLAPAASHTWYYVMFRNAVHALHSVLSCADAFHRSMSLHSLPFPISSTFQLSTLILQRWSSYAAKEEKYLTRSLFCLNSRHPSRSAVTSTDNTSICCDSLSTEVSPQRQIIYF